MSALDRLEKVARIPIFNKLAPKYLDMASALYFHETVLDDLRNTNNPVEGSKAVMRTWLLGKSSLTSTWQVLLEKLQAIGMGKLAQGIEQFFTMKPVFSPSLMSESKKDLELELSEVDNKEWQTKPDCKDVAVQNNPDCREVAIQTHSGTTAVDFLCGVDVLGETEFTVPTQGDSFEWKGYGLKLYVSEGSLPEGMEECRIVIRMSLSGHFQLPEDSNLLSPVFWILPSCQFTKPVTLEIQHCAFREDEAVLSYLSFVSTEWSQRDLPYKFGQVDGGLFTTHSSYGIIQLSHFSGNAVTGRKRTPRSYCAHVYHTMKQMYDWRYYFVITQDLDAMNTVVKEHYGHFARQEATLRIRFERSEITLNIPEDGLVTKEGWRITPFSFPTITRKDADQFKPGQWIPECQLIVQWCEEDRRPVQLRHKVGLIGAKAPYNFFYLTMNPAVEHWEEMVRQLSTSSGGTMEYNQSHTPDMKDLMDALYHTVAEKWECIGIYLHLPMPMLKAITAEHRHDPHRCLIGMLEVWLKRVDPPPTWSAIIEAVEFLGEEKLARELRKKYCH